MADFLKIKKVAFKCEACSVWSYSSEKCDILDQDEGISGTEMHSDHC